MFGYEEEEGGGEEQEEIEGEGEEERHSTTGSISSISTFTSASVNQVLMTASDVLPQQEIDKGKASFKASPPAGVTFCEWPNKHHATTPIVRCGCVGKLDGDDNHYLFCQATRLCQANSKKGVSNSTYVGCGCDLYCMHMYKLSPLQIIMYTHTDTCRKFGG